MNRGPFIQPLQHPQTYTRSDSVCMVTCRKLMHNNHQHSHATMAPVVLKVVFPSAARPGFHSYVVQNGRCTVLSLFATLRYQNMKSELIKVKTPWINLSLFFSSIFLVMSGFLITL